MIRFLARPTALAALCVLLAGGAARASVPSPAETPAKVIVSGLTSTAVDIKVVKAGQDIPKTYAGTHIANTPGFEFYVSQHYALKSNMGDDFSRHILEISELAYPHWVALVGHEPPDPDKRMYIVYGSDSAKMIQAMLSDLGSGPLGGFGGGITIWENRSAYNYPSGTLLYHRRALVIHENLHMLNLVVNGTPGTEGMTFSGEQHVYDPVRKQLTVFCFDKATVNNHTDDGLNALQKTPISIRTAVDTLGQAGGGPGVIYTQFFLTDPDRYFKWCIWRDELYRKRLDHEPNAKVMEDIFGPLDKLDDTWTKWVKERHNSFHFVDWGWEQEGNWLVAYGFPWDNHYFSQTDLRYTPAEKAVYDPLRMDYPAEPVPPTVGPVHRGVAEPSVGYVMDFARSRGCWGGMGLGVDGRTMCQVVLARERLLVIDGSAFGISRREVPLTADLVAAGKADGHRFGVTVRIGPRELLVTVRAGKPGAMRAMTASAPLDPTQHQRLMTRYMSVIGRDGYPAVMPFIDDARRLPPDLTRPAPANRWRFGGEKELYALYRAAWRLKELAPESLTDLRSRMVAAVDKEPAAQQAAMALYRQRIVEVIRDVKAVPNKEKGEAAAAELAGPHS